MEHLEQLVRFYENLGEDDIARFATYYREDAYFKDPFNEVRGLAGIQRVFRHMFRQVVAPRFEVKERLVAETGAMLVWELHFRSPRGAEQQIIRGVSHLRFDASGRVSYHRDYWDTAEELYQKLPLLGGLMRFLRARLAA